MGLKAETERGRRVWYPDRQIPPFKSVRAHVRINESVALNLSQSTYHIKRKSQNETKVFSKKLYSYERLTLFNFHSLPLTIFIIQKKTVSLLFSLNIILSRKILQSIEI